MSILYSKSMSNTTVNNGNVSRDSISYTYDGNKLNITTDDDGQIGNYQLDNNEVMDLLSVMPAKEPLTSRIKALTPGGNAAPKKRKNTKKRKKRKYKKMTKRKK